MRIFFPLKIFSYPQYDCSEDEREDISSRDAVSYEDQILAAIAKENRHFENDRGLAEYIHDEALKEKVHSLYPTVEVVDGELWGVMTAGLKETLTGEETAALIYLPIYLLALKNSNISMKEDVSMDQTNLLNLPAVDDEDSLKGKYLIFTMGNELYGIEIRYITEILGIQPITEVPEMPG